jgi:hypothetical protein
MSILNVIKGETTNALEKKIVEITAATDRARNACVEEQTNVADIVERLATAELYGSDTSALSAEHTRSSQRILTLDLAVKKGEAELEKFNQKLVALREKGEREKYAAGLNKIADEWEKQLPAFRKAARAVADTYLSLPESAVASFNGATGGVLKSNIPLCDAFAHGDGIESAIRDLRQHAAMIVSGERALPLASDRTLGSRLQMFGLNPRAA